VEFCLDTPPANAAFISGFRIRLGCLGRGRQGRELAGGDCIVAS
jgi:hypothetical protein